jgi:hypothetical protein
MSALPPDSGQIPQRSEMTLRATTGLMRRNKLDANHPM